MFQRPIFQTSQLVFEHPQPSRPSIAKLLKQRCEDRIIKVVREGSGRRATIYAFADLINLCEGRNVF
jgi:hypothetical protein